MYNIGSMTIVDVRESCQNVLYTFTRLHFGYIVVTFNMARVLV